MKTTQHHGQAHLLYYLQNCYRFFSFSLAFLSLAQTKQLEYAWLRTLCSNDTDFPAAEPII